MCKKLQFSLLFNFLYPVAEKNLKNYKKSIQQPCTTMPVKNVLDGGFYSVFIRTETRWRLRFVLTYSAEVVQQLVSLLDPTFTGAKDVAAEKVVELLNSRTSDDIEEIAKGQGFPELDDTVDGYVPLSRASSKSSVVTALEIENPDQDPDVDRSHHVGDTNDKLEELQKAIALEAELRARLLVDKLANMRKENAKLRSHSHTPLVALVGTAHHATACAPRSLSASPLAGFLGQPRRSYPATLPTPPTFQPPPPLPPSGQVGSPSCDREPDDTMSLHLATADTPQDLMRLMNTMAAPISGVKTKAKQALCPTIATIRRESNLDIPQSLRHNDADAFKGVLWPICVIVLLAHWQKCLRAYVTPCSGHRYGPCVAD